MATNRGPYLPNLEPYYQVLGSGWHGLPPKMGGTESPALPFEIADFIRNIDKQDALNRYKWFNLPDGLTGEMIERVLYYRGQGALVFNDIDEKFYFLPYCLDGNIDVYGRFTGIRVLPFNGHEDDETEHIISQTRYIPRYDFPEGIPTIEEMDASAFLLHDYAIGISQINPPRCALQEPIIQLMSKCLPFMNTALMNGTGILGVRTQPGEEQSVYDASRAIENSALTGQKYVPLTGAMDFQELTGGDVAKAEEFLLAM